MEGFLRFSLPPWQRRMLTRLVAMVPAAIVAAVAGNRGAGKLLVLSQVQLQCHCLPSRFCVLSILHRSLLPWVTQCCTVLG